MFKRWLTRDERQNLDADERKKLRRERKEKATEAGERWWQNVTNWLEVDLDIKVRTDRFDDVIIEAIQEVNAIPAMTRNERFSEIIDIASERLDELIELEGVKLRIGPVNLPLGRILEQRDDDIIRFALRGLVLDLILARLDDEAAPDVTLD